MEHLWITELVPFILMAMGMAALYIGITIHLRDKTSMSAKKMLGVCFCVFMWNFGYAWMSNCRDDFAYIPRAIALAFVFLYMFCVLDYVTYLSGFPRKKLVCFAAFLFVPCVVSWYFIVRRDAVRFVNTPWGYWYVGHLTWARILQFVCIILNLILYYIILDYWKKKSNNQRVKYIIKKFNWFGVILGLGALLDTVLPVIFNIAAIPGSSIASFASAMLLYLISRAYMAVDYTVANVAEYVFRDVATPVLIFDSEDKLVLFNDATMKFYDRSEGVLTGKDKAALFELYDKNEKIYRVHDKQIFYKIQTTAVMDTFDEVVYTIVFITDMTKEQEMMQLLFDSREEANSANRAKSNFLANMSHEIRTPMNAIIGMSDIVLQRNLLENEDRANIENIKSAGNNLLEIINDILQISKIEAGKFDLIEEEYDLQSMLYYVKNIIQVRADAKNIRFSIKISEDMPEKLIGDEKRIRQILINILGNAVKYTEEGYVRLFVSWNFDMKKPVLFFRVTDTGIGIKKEDLNNIFGVFTQVDTRKNRNIQGTGLGLSICKQLAQMMDGDIEVCSIYGEGSEFRISLGQRINIFTKLGIDKAKAIEDNTYRPDKKKTRSIVTRPDARVLVVDDVELNLLVAKGIMKPYRMKIDTATSGKQAVELVQKNNYDIIFMDHMMPELDGIDTTHIIRKLAGGRYADIPIIAFSASASNASKKLFEDEGMQGYLTKPLQIDELDAMLNKWLKQEDGQVLIVDENEMLLHIMQRHIEQYGMKVDTAVNGEEAVKKCMDNRYNFVLIDTLINDMNQFETKDAIKGISEHYQKSDSCKIIAMSDGDVGDTPDGYVIKGFDSYISSVNNFKELDKIFGQTETQYDADAAENNLDIEGLDIHKGIELCGGEMSDYIEVLKISIRTARQKLETLAQYRVCDADRYRIDVHGLKGLCYSIGAQALGDRAKELEFAVKDNKPEIITEKGEVFEQDISRFFDVLEERLGEAEPASKIQSEFDYKECIRNIKSAVDSFDFPMVDKLLEGMSKEELDDEQRSVCEEMIRLAQDIDVDGLYEVIDTALC